MCFYKLFYKKNKKSPVLEGFTINNPLLDQCLICKATDVDLFVVQNRLLCGFCVEKFDDFVKNSQPILST
jgi:hypothetical protein